MGFDYHLPKHGLKPSILIKQNRYMQLTVAWYQQFFLNIQKVHFYTSTLW